MNSLTVLYLAVKYYAQSLWNKLVALVRPSSTETETTTTTNQRGAGEARTNAQYHYRPRNLDEYPNKDR